MQRIKINECKVIQNFSCMRKKNILVSYLYFNYAKGIKLKTFNFHLKFDENLVLVNGPASVSFSSPKSSLTNQFNLKMTS